MSEGWQMMGDIDAIELTRGSYTFCFDIKVPTSKGVLYCMYLKRIPHETEVSALKIDAQPNKLRKVSVNFYHAQLGHINERDTRDIAKILQQPLQNLKFTDCEACARAKAAKKPLKVIQVKHKPKHQWGGKSRMFLDISTLKRQLRKKKHIKLPINKPNWRLMVDERTQLKFSHFCKTKNAMVEPTLKLLHLLEQQGFAVEVIRMDNAGENTLLKERAHSADWKLSLLFELTARDTPQQNHLVELGFKTLISRSRAMMIGANIPPQQRHRFARMCILTATKLDSLQVISIDGVKQTRHYHYFGTQPSFANHL